MIEKLFKKTKKRNVKKIKILKIKLLVNKTLMEVKVNLINNQYNRNSGKKE